MQETQVRSLGWEDPLEKGMTTHSSTLAWKIPWTEEPGRTHGITEGRTQLSDFPFTFHFHALEKEMAPHSSVLAWGIPWTEEPGGLQSMGQKESDVTESLTRWNQGLTTLGLPTP